MNSVWKTLVFLGLCHGVSKATQCISSGRFPNNNEEDCRGFTICLGVRPNFTHYDLTCPPKFVYSHLDNQCTNITSYLCFPKYNCSDVGNFDVPDIENCDSYISCAEGPTGMTTARLIHCKNKTVFSPIEGACIDEALYSCEKNKSTIVEPSIPQASTDHLVEIAGTFGVSRDWSLRANHELLVCLLFFCVLIKI